MHKSGVLSCSAHFQRSYEDFVLCSCWALIHCSFTAETSRQTDKERRMCLCRASCIDGRFITSSLSLRSALDRRCPTALPINRQRITEAPSIERLNAATYTLAWLRWLWIWCRHESSSISRARTALIIASVGQFYCYKVFICNHRPLLVSVINS